MASWRIRRFCAPLRERGDGGKAGGPPEIQDQDEKAALYRATRSQEPRPSLLEAAAGKMSLIPREGKLYRPQPRAQLHTLLLTPREAEHNKENQKEGEEHERPCTFPDNIESSERLLEEEAAMIPNTDKCKFNFSSPSQPAEKIWRGEGEIRYTVKNKEVKIPMRLLIRCK